MFLEQNRLHGGGGGGGGDDGGKGMDGYGWLEELDHSISILRFVAISSLVSSSLSSTLLLFLFLSPL